jgi:signal peptidase II
MKIYYLKNHLIFWLIAAGGFLFDIWTKSAVFEWLIEKTPPRFVLIDGFLQFILAENAGAAFGIAAGQKIFLIALSAIAFLVILGIVFFSRQKNVLIYVYLGLFAAGVCGNLYDRIFNDGRVRDFIDVVYWPGRHWPAFNVADSLLCIAVGLMIVQNIFIKDKSSQKPAQLQK